jgi:hypothetical protein
LQPCLNDEPVDDNNDHYFYGPCDDEQRRELYV